VEIKKEDVAIQEEIANQDEVKKVVEKCNENQLEQNALVIVAKEDTPENTTVEKKIDITMSQEVNAELDNLDVKK